MSSRYGSTMSLSLAGRGEAIVTPEESTRIRDTVQSRLRKCQDLKQQPRAFSDPKTRSRQVAMASLLAGSAGTSECGRSTKSGRTDATCTLDWTVQPMKRSDAPMEAHHVSATSGRPDAVTFLAVGCPYPPCTLPVQNLRPMKLSDLRMDTHHRGGVITLQRIAPVVKSMVRSWTVLQEPSSGESERLEILLHQFENGLDVLDMESMFMIKEPYYTIGYDGSPTLRIDHPSDLVVCEGSLDGTSEEFLFEGNAAVKERALPQALVEFDRGLQLVADDTVTDHGLACDLFRSRANVNLLLGRFDEARADGIASLTGIKDQKHRALDAKACFRIGCAAYQLGDFHEAKKCFEEQQRLAPSDEDATVYLRKTEARLYEQSTGQYNFKKIRAGLFKKAPRVDAASFDRNTEVRDSPGRGRGLFAARDMAIGELILCEKAFCVVWGHGDEAWTVTSYDVRDDLIRRFPATLCKNIVQKLLDNPSQVEKVMDLYGDYKGVGGKQLNMTDGNPVIDTFQVHDIVARNAFGLGPVNCGMSNAGEKAKNAGTGLWIRGAYANHSCVSNAQKEFIGDLMVLRAARAISRGEEITHNYVQSSEYFATTTALNTTWGFTCTCELCAAEGAAFWETRRAWE